MAALAKLAHYSPVTLLATVRGRIPLLHRTSRYLLGVCTGIRDSRIYLVYRSTCRVGSYIRGSYIRQHVQGVGGTAAVVPYIYYTRSSSVRVHSYLPHILVVVYKYIHKRRTYTALARSGWLAGWRRAATGCWLRGAALLRRCDGGGTRARARARGRDAMAQQ